MPDITEDALRAVRDRASLFDFLGRSLGWETSSDDTFTYLTPPQPGLPEDRVEVSRLVPFGGVPFVLMLAEFQTPFRRTDLRKILQGIRRDDRLTQRYGGASPEEIIFVCPTQDYGGVSFAHFEEREGRAPKLEVFGWEQDHLHETRTLRTIALPALQMPGRNALDEYDWTVGRAQWLKAWDVEQVTGAFFKRYKEVFNAAQTHMDGIEGEDGRLCAQRLFNRLLFIRFLEKKGWLTFGGRHDYLCALWEDYQAKRPEGGINFYHSRLKPLFFAALNQPHVRDGRGDTWLTGLVGNVPYLNGGLFDDTEDKKEAERYPGLVINDAALGPVVTDFFYSYNFTVTESTPDDVEVAVDPEMLGKVFEELVTASERHGTGSYYTPRGIVSFMCREALKGYLGGHAALVDERTADALSKKQAGELIGKLKAVKVVDPAGGSGAYVLGMLHELFDLIGLLEVRADPMTPQGKYKRKLEIIQNCLYAVDKEPFAVNIARLRLWLSLAVEFEGDTPEPLPSLDFKVEAGDSLAAPSPQVVEAQVDTRDHLLREFEKKKREFGDPYYTGPISKADLKAQAEALRADIATWTHAGKKVAGFDWRVEFCEVFQRPEPVADLGGALNLGGTLSEPAAPGGFDIVLANPPYVRQELIKDQKPTLKAVYPEVYNGTADLYCYFYARAVQLLRPGGMLAFISPNKWFRAGYGGNLRSYLAETCHVDSITDFGDLPVFQTAITYPMILTAQKDGVPGGTAYTKVKSLAAPYPDVRAVIELTGATLPAEAIQGADWALTDAAASGRIAKMKKAGVPLGEYVNKKMYRGVLTGFNAAFVINSARRAELITADPKSMEIIKPLYVGRDIRCWAFDERDQWLIFTRRGIDITAYPAIEKHLAQWKAQLTPKTGEVEQGRKPGKYKWFEIQDEVTYFNVFDKPKIVYPEVSNSPRFTLDTKGVYPLKTCFVIDSQDLYLLGVLNSSSFLAYQRLKQNTVRGGYLMNSTIYLEVTPIPNASDADRAAIAALVQKCLDAKGVGCEAWEAEINGRVAALYGL